MTDYFIGLMSGTSMDALDAVLVDFSHSPPRLVATHSYELDEALRHEILALAQPGDNELDRLAQLDVRLGRLSAQVVLQLLEKAGRDSNKIQAIGSHGQTIRHAPNSTYPYTMQIADPNTIAQLSGITTVADFRVADGERTAKREVDRRDLLPSHRGWGARKWLRSPALLSCSGWTRRPSCPAHPRSPG